MLEILERFYKFLMEQEIKTGNYIAIYNDGELVETVKR